MLGCLSQNCLTLWMLPCKVFFSGPSCKYFVRPFYIKIKGYQVVKPNIYSPHVFVFSIQQYAWLVGSQYKPMELVKSDWAAIKKSPPWSIDSWGMGMLFYVLFNYDAL